MGRSTISVLSDQEAAPLAADQVLQIDVNAS